MLGRNYFFKMQKGYHSGRMLQLRTYKEKFLTTRVPRHWLQCGCSSFYSL